MILSVIIVSYNTVELLRNCLRSIKNASGIIEYEVIVVDNNSTDGSVQMVNNEFPEVIIIVNPRNVGFGVANNQGVHIARGDFILLLNSDTIVYPGAFQSMVDYLKNHPDVKIVGPCLLNPDMSVQMQCKRGFPRFLNSLGHFSGLAYLFPTLRPLNGYLSPLPNDVTHEVDAVSGACLMITRNVIDQAGGLFDEQYFMHFEDIDLCFRIKKLGYKIYYIHSAKVVHLKGQSSRIKSQEVV